MIEVGKIGINLKDPVRLDQYYCADINGVVSFCKKGFVLDPRNDVMQIPRNDEKDDCRR